MARVVVCDDDPLVRAADHDGVRGRGARGGGRDRQRRRRRRDGAPLRRRRPRARPVADRRLRRAHPRALEAEELQRGGRRVHRLRRDPRTLRRLGAREVVEKPDFELLGEVLSQRRRLGRRLGAQPTSAGSPAARSRPHPRSGDRPPGCARTTTSPTRCSAGGRATRSLAVTVVGPRGPRGRCRSAAHRRLPARRRRRSCATSSASRTCSTKPPRSTGSSRCSEAATPGRRGRVVAPHRRAAQRVAARRGEGRRQPGRRDGRRRRRRPRHRARCRRRRVGSPSFVSV